MSDPARAPAAAVAVGSAAPKPMLDAPGARRFLIAFLGTLAIGGALLAPNALVLRHVHEFDDVREVAARQLRQGGLYGSGLREDTSRYKLALYRQVRPDVVALG